MDPQEFNTYIKAPERLDRDSLAGIASLAGEFPYCQSLRILHLLNLRITNEVMYSEQLKTTAAYIADRKRLRELVAGLNNRAGEQGTGNREQASGNEKEVLEEAGIAEAGNEEVVTGNTEQGTDDVEPAARNPEPIVPAIEQDEEARLLALKQIVENRLKEISDAKDESAEEEVEGHDKKLSKEQIIDKFIEEEPSISRPKADFFDPVKVARKSQKEQDGIVSETLARIHIQQGNIAKAIEIYRKLSLNFPEKSSYFAAQIEKINTDN